MNLKSIIACAFLLGFSLVSFSQKQSKPAAAEGVLFFSLSAQKGGKLVTIVKDNGRAMTKDSLKMADGITATYKVGQKTSNVKGILYDSYFLSDTTEPVILQDIDRLSFDKSIWTTCIDSLHKKEQVVFQIREITLDDGTKIQNPKLSKESKAIYIVRTNENFPPGGWEAKAKHWISMWKEWFRLRDDTFYKLDDKKLELYASGVVFIIK